MDNKSFIEELSNRLGFSPEKTGQLVNLLSETIASEAEQLHTVSIASFGDFEPFKRMERIVVHPSSGKTMLVPPKVMLKFRPSVMFRKNGK